MASTKQPYIFQPKGGMWRWNRLEVPDGFFWTLYGYKYEKGALWPTSRFGSIQTAGWSVVGFCGSDLIQEDDPSATSGRFSTTRMWSTYSAGSGRRLESDPDFMCWGPGIDAGTVTSAQISTLTATTYRVFINGVNKGDFDTTLLERYFATEGVYFSVDIPTLIFPRVYQWTTGVSTKPTGVSWGRGKGTVSDGNGNLFVSGPFGVIYQYLPDYNYYKQVSTNLVTGQWPCWFNDHLVVANAEVCYGNSSGNAVLTGEVNDLLWSDLRRPDIFKATDLNEADSYNSSNTPTSAVTGLIVYQDRLVVFYPNTIEVGEYVGLPTVMKFSTLSRTVGGNLIATTRRGVYFSNPTGLYRLSGSEIERIDPGFSLTSIPTSGWYRKLTEEIVFNTAGVVASTQAGAPSPAGFLVYNERENAWYIQPTIFNYSSPTAVISESPLFRLRFTQGAATYYEETYGSTVVQDVLVSMSPTYLPPYFETGWMHFGDRLRVKEIDTCKIDAWWTESGYAASFELLGCLKEFVGDPHAQLSYTSYTTKTLTNPPGGRQSLPRLSFNYIAFLGRLNNNNVATQLPRVAGVSSIQFEVLQNKAEK